MTTHRQKARRSVPVLYSHDTVRRAGANDVKDDKGFVVRTWHEEAADLAEGMPPEEIEAMGWAGIARELKEGEVGVIWSNKGSREILQESDVVLTDR